MTIGPEKVWYVNCSNYHKDLPLHLPNFTWWLCAKTMYLSTHWRRCKIVWLYLWWSALCPGHQRRNTWVSSVIWDDYIRYINIRDIKEKSICVRSVAWVGGGRGRMTNHKRRQTGGPQRCWPALHEGQQTMDSFMIKVIDTVVWDVLRRLSRLDSFFLRIQNWVWDLKMIESWQSPVELVCPVVEKMLQFPQMIMFPSSSSS